LKKQELGVSGMSLTAVNNSQSPDGKGMAVH